MELFFFQEVELLFEENEALQRKLVSIEEDFRIQNETIMKELSQVSTTQIRLKITVIALANARPCSCKCRTPLISWLFNAVW